MRLRFSALFDRPSSLLSWVKPVISAGFSSVSRHSVRVFGLRLTVFSLVVRVAVGVGASGGQKPVGNCRPAKKPQGLLRRVVGQFRPNLFPVIREHFPARYQATGSGFDCGPMGYGDRPCAVSPAADVGRVGTDGFSQGRLATTLLREVSFDVHS